MLGGGGAYDHTLARLQQGRADTCHLGGTLAAGVDDLRDALPDRAAEVEGGELVEVAHLTPLQASGGRLYREVGSRPLPGSSRVRPYPRFRVVSLPAGKNLARSYLPVVVRRALDDNRVDPVPGGNTRRRDPFHERCRDHGRPVEPGGGGRGERARGRRHGVARDHDPAGRYLRCLTPWHGQRRSRGDRYRRDPGCSFPARDASPVHRWGGGPGLQGTEGDWK